MKRFTVSTMLKSMDNPQIVILGVYFSGIMNV